MNKFLIKKYHDVLAHLISEISKLELFYSAPNQINLIQKPGPNGEPATGMDAHSAQILVQIRQQCYALMQSLEALAKIGKVAE